MSKMCRRRILVEGAWFSPFGFDSTSGKLEFNWKHIIIKEKRFSLDVEKTLKMHWHRILVEGAWFSPFGFDSTSGKL